MPTADLTRGIWLPHRRPSTQLCSSSASFSAEMTYHTIPSLPECYNLSSPTFCFTSDTMAAVSSWVKGWQARHQIQTNATNPAWLVFSWNLFLLIKGPVSDPSTPYVFMRFHCSVGFVWGQGSLVLLPEFIVLLLTFISGLSHQLHLLFSSLCFPHPQLKCSNVLMSFTSHIFSPDWLSQVQLNLQKNVTSGSWTKRDCSKSTNSEG